MMQSSQRQFPRRSLANRDECIGFVEVGEPKTRDPRAEIRKKAEGRNPKGSGLEDSVRTLDLLQPSSPAFTLLEIMIVVGIMGIIMTMGVPMVYKVWHRAPMAKALTDIVEVCSNARARAILGGREVDVIFHPRDGRLEVGSVAAPQPQASPQPGTPDSLPATPAPGSGLSAQLVDGMVIRALGINLVDFTDADSARVRFFPNGTCDEMLMVINSPQNEQRGISLEITTGLASVLSESDLQKLRERLR
jgi:prepilin-type N-terminal cleavage/methylation domain-containing protein